MKKFLQLILVALCVATAAQVYAKTWTVYFDNSVGKWDDVAVYVWNGQINNGWPGQKADKINDRWYSCTISSEEEYVNVLFNNNKNEGASKTSDLVLTDGMRACSKGTMQAVDFDNFQSGWEKVCLHYWGDGFGTEWPGNEIVYRDDAKVYVDYIPSATQGFIFNNGKGGQELQQTENLTDANRIYYHNTGTTAKSKASFPVAVYAIGSRLYVYGDVNSEGDYNEHDWDISWKDGNRLYYQGDGSFYIERLVVGPQNENKYGQIRFIENPSGDWNNAGEQFYPDSKYDGVERGTEGATKSITLDVSKTKGTYENWKFVTEETTVDDVSSYYSYDFKLDLFRMELTVTGTTGVESVSEDDVNAPVEYFNLQGVRVENPQNGLYIVRQGNKVSKQIIR